MAEQPPLSRIHVVGYSANDRDFPVLNLVLDPRVAGYQVPKDLSACPDKRYPNHVFTGAQPIAGDQRVRHVWEILPSPWVPFTRYDDDLGPVQGRRRSVKNEGQVASLTADKRVTYEAREGSAIVYTELEETWSIKVDEDGNSLFPIRDRDFYDPSRGPVQERRQLFVPTGEEEGSLENINGVITQTSYEPYSEFLSVKIVQTYKVDGPQLVGQSTNNEGQLVTITTQRKAAEGYVPPTLTATRTVEANREDAESIVERIVDSPKVFGGLTFSRERPDVTPPKFRTDVQTYTLEQTVAGTATDPTLGTIDLSRSEQQLTEFVKRTRVTKKLGSQQTLLTGQVYTSELGGGVATVDETFIQNAIGGGVGDLKTDDIKTTHPELGVIYKTGLISAESENLGGNKFVKRVVALDSIEELIGQDYDDTLDVRLPFKQKVVPAKEPLPSEGAVSIQPRDVANSLRREYDTTVFEQQISEYYRELPDFVDVNLPDRLVSATAIFSRAQGSSFGSGEGSTFSYQTEGSSSLVGEIVYDVESGYSGIVPATRYLFFLPKDKATTKEVARVIRQKDSEAGRTLTTYYPNVRPKSHIITLIGGRTSQNFTRSVSVNSSSESSSSSADASVGTSRSPATIHPDIPIEIFAATPSVVSSGSGSVVIPDGITPRILVSGSFPSSSQYTTKWEENSTKSPAIPATSFTEFPDGRYLVNIDASPYRFGFVRVEAVVADIFSPYVGDNSELISPEYPPIIPIDPEGQPLKIRPATPQNLTISSVATTQFQASWSFVDFADYYFIDVSTNAEFSSYVSGYQNRQVGLTTILVSGLTENTTYYIRVRAFNDVGTSSFTPTTTQTTAPA